MKIITYTDWLRVSSSDGLDVGEKALKPVLLRWCWRCRIVGIVFGWFRRVSSSASVDDWQQLVDWGELGLRLKLEVSNGDRPRTLFCYMVWSVKRETIECHFSTMMIVDFVCWS